MYIKGTQRALVLDKDILVWAGRGEVAFQPGAFSEHHPSHKHKSKPKLTGPGTSDP